MRVAGSDQCPPQREDGRRQPNMPRTRRCYSMQSEMPPMAALRGCLAHEEHIAGCEIQDSRKVRKVRSPVSPGGHESGEVAERTLRPDVEAAFIWIARRKFDHRKGQRRIKRKPGADPDDNRTRAGGSSSGNPAQADAGDYVKKQQVAESHDPLGATCVRSFRDEDAASGDGGGFRVTHAR